MTRRKISIDTTVGAVRQWLRARMGKGTRCPCCNQHVQVYRRSLGPTWAATLIAMNNAEGDPRHDLGDGWMRTTALLRSIDHELAQRAAQSSDWGKMVEWGLIEMQVGENEINHHPRRSGIYRLTDDGHAFVRGELLVPSHSISYSGGDHFASMVLGVRMGLDGELISIAGVLDRKGFDYRDIIWKITP